MPQNAPKPKLPLAARPVRYSIDYCAFHQFRAGGCMTVLSGWMDMEGIDHLLTLDEKGENPALLRLCHWPRADVDAILGPCLNPRQSAYGLLGLVESASPPCALLGSANGECFIIGALEGAACPLPQNLLDAIFDPPLNPCQESTACRHIPPFVEKLLREGIAETIGAGIAELAVGKPVANPEYSLIVHCPAGHAPSLAQMLAFSEDVRSGRRIEALYVADSAGSQSDLQEICWKAQAICGMGARLVCARAPLGQAAAFNLGARLAKGKYLVFAHPEMVPDCADILGSMKNRLENEGMAGMAVCPSFDEHGLCNGCLRRMVLNDAPMPAQEIQARREAAPPAPGGAAFPASGMAMIRRGLFEELGGLDPAYLNAWMAWADFAQKLWDAGKRVSPAPEAKIFRPREARQDDLPAREERKGIWDSLRFRKKWIGEIFYKNCSGGRV